MSVLKIFTGIIVTLILVWGLINAGTWFLTRLVLFHPDPLPENYQYAFEHPFEEIFIEHPCGRLNALHFKKDKPSPKGVVLFFHGNAGNLAMWGRIHEQFTDLGYDVLIYDYGTYGKSKGALKESCLYREALACYEYLVKQYSPKNIMLYGRSLGSAIATELATRKKVSKIILEGPFASVPDVFYRLFPFLPRIFPFPYKFSNIQNIQKIKVPIYIFHGTRDQVVPISSSLKLKPYLNQENNYIQIQGAGHNNLDSFKKYHKHLKAIFAGDITTSYSP